MTESNLITLLENALQLTIASSGISLVRSIIALMKLGHVKIRPLLVRLVKGSFLTTLHRLLSLPSIELKSSIFELLVLIIQNFSEGSDLAATLTQTVLKLHSLDMEKAITLYLSEVLKDQLLLPPVVSSPFYQPYDTSEFPFLLKPIITLTSDLIENISHAMVVANILSLNVATHASFFVEHSYLNQQVIIKENLFSLIDRIFQSLALNPLSAHHQSFGGFEGSDIETNLVLCILRMLFSICSNQSAGRGKTIRSYAFVDAVIRVVARSTYPPIIADGTRLLYLFAYHPSFSATLLMTKQQKALCYAVAKILVYPAPEFAPYLPNFMETLTYLLFQIYVNDTIHRSKYGMAESSIWCAKEIFMHVPENDNLWALLLQYSQSSEQACFAARLIHVLLCYREADSLESIHNRVQAWSIIECMVARLPKENQNLSKLSAAETFLIESILYCLATACGSPGYFSWETSIICQRLSSSEIIPVWEEEMMLFSQKRNDYDEQLIAIFHASESNHKISWVAEREKDMRQIYIASINTLISPYISGYVNLSISVAAMRLAQVFARDPLCTSILAQNANILSFVTYFDVLDPVTMIIALDVFGIVTSSTTTANGPALQAIITRISLAKNSNAYVSAKILTTLLLSAANPSTHSTILTFGSSMLSKLLYYDSHVKDGMIDSSHMVMSAMLMIYRITSMQEGLTNHFITTRKEIIKYICQLAVAGDEIIDHQVLQPNHRIYSSFIDRIYQSVISSSSIKIRGVALLTLMSLSQYESCKQSLLESNIITTTLLQILCEVYLCYQRDEGVTRELDGAYTSADGAYALLETIDLAHRNLQSDDKRIGSFHDYLQANLSSYQVLYFIIEILFFLSSKPSNQLYESITTSFPLAIAVFFSTWTNCHRPHLSYMCLTILKRGSVYLDPATLGMIHTDLMQNASCRAMIDSQQIYLSADMICMYTPPDGMRVQSTMDPESDFIARNQACEVIRRILWTSVDRPNHSTIRETIIDLSSTNRFLDKLEILAPRSIHAALLLAEIFAWPEISFANTSLSFLNTIVNLVYSSNKIIQRSAIRILHSAVMQDEDTKVVVVSSIPRLEISTIIESIISQTLFEVRAVFSFDSNGYHNNNAAAVDPGSSSSTSISNDKEKSFISDVAPIDCLVSSLIIMCCFYESSADLNYEETQLSDTETRALAVACEGLTEVLYQRTNQLLGINGTQVASMDITTIELWKALSLLSSIKPCAAVLLKSSCVINLGNIFHITAFSQMHRLTLSSTTAGVSYFQYHAPYQSSSSSAVAIDAVDESFLLVHIIKVYLHFSEFFDDRVADILLQSNIVNHLIDYFIIHAYAASTTDDQYESSDFINVSRILSIVQRSVAVRKEMIDHLLQADNLLSTLIHILSIYSLQLQHRYQVADPTDFISIATDLSNTCQVFFENLLCLASNICRTSEGRKVVYLQVSPYLRTLLALPAQHGGKLPVQVLVLHLHLFTHFTLELQSISIDAAATEDNGHADTGRSNKTVHNLIITTVNVLIQTNDATSLDLASSLLMMLSSRSLTIQILSTSSYLIALLYILSKLLPCPTSRAQTEADIAFGIVLVPEMDEAALLKSKACYNSLRLFQLLVANRDVCSSLIRVRKMRDLVYHIMNVLMGSPRNMLWFPAMLRAAEILQVSSLASRDPSMSLVF
jgi:hypothetical protein